MTMLIKFIVCFIAGIGAGLGTGFAGMSAAAVISPMLITFLDMPAYEAVGIALASDVLASAVSAYTYGKNKNLDIRNGVVMMVSVLCFTMVGSWIASQVPNSTMGSFSVFMTFLLGVKFIVKPVMTTKNAMEAVDPKKRFVQSVICGVMIGFICGFIGAGGGMMMLLILTSVLGYELKTAVGTSVFIMTFTAFTGAVSHFAIGGMPNLWCLVFCVGSTLLWARIAARFANKASPATLNRATGVVLVVLLLVLILPSSKIDLASKISASTQASVRAEHQQNFASSNEMEFEVYSSSDEIYQNISEVLSGVRCVRRLSQNYSSYSHEFPVDSITVSYYDDAEQHQLLLTVYSDGVCILNNAFVSVKYPGGGAAELYQALAEIVE